MSYLDPSPGVGFPQLREAAVLTRALLTELGIRAYVETTGSRGLHLYVAPESGLMDAPWPPVYPKMPNEPPRVAPSRAKK